MSWNYRVVRHRTIKDPKTEYEKLVDSQSPYYYAIQEVWYDDETGKMNGHSSTEEDVAESIDELRKQLERKLRAVTYAMLNDYLDESDLSKDEQPI